MNLIQELIALQHEHGYLRESDLLDLAQRTRTPLYEIEGLSSFFPHFRTTPPAPLRVRACRDLACYQRDGGAALADLEDSCAGRDDVEFSRTSCLGRCDQAPACTLNGIPLSTSEASLLIRESQGDSANLEAQARSVPRTQTRTSGWQTDPYDAPGDRYGIVRGCIEEHSIPRSGPFIIERLSNSGLRGMGGAGFPTGRKWDLVRRADAHPRYVICNADESEPGTFKDRVLLAELPHLILEGMLMAGLAVGSHEGWIFIRHEYEAERIVLERAIGDARAAGALGKSVFGSGFDFDVQIFISPGGYIMGEETALLEALEGRRGEPRNKPPYPGVVGLYGQPTLINNVETFCHVPRIVETGRAALKFFSLSGDVETPGVVEVPLGTPLDALIERCGGMRGGRELLAFLPGGASTGFLSASHREIEMDWAPLQKVGTALGSGAVFIVAQGADMRALALNLSEFFRNESCGKCVPCRIGTEKAVRVIEAGGADAIPTLVRLHEILRETSICGLGQAALNPIMSVIENFPTAMPTQEDIS